MKPSVLMMGRRALRWIEKLRAPVGVLTKIAHEPEGSQQGLLMEYMADPAAAAYLRLAGYHIHPRERLDPGTLEAATAYLKRIGYPGEAGAN